MAWLVLLFLCALATPGTRGELVDSSVEKLDGSTFQSQVVGTSHVWVVSFVGDDCQPCRDFTPDYNSAALALRGIVKVGLLNCNQHGTVCAKERIEQLPTVKGYTWEVKRNPYTGQAYKEDGILYSGSLRSKDVSKFATGLLPHQFVANVSAGSSFEAFSASHPTRPKVLLFSAKGSVAPMYRALSLRFHSTAVFGQAKATDQALVDHFSPTSFPAIFMLPAGQKLPPVRFSGNVDPESIAAFIRGFAPESGPEEGNATAQASTEGEGAGEGDEERWGWVKRLSGKTFQTDVLKNEEQFLVAFLDLSAADDCREKLKGWRALGKQLPGLVFAGEVNVTTSEQRDELAAAYKVPEQLGKACVSLVLYPFGDEKEEADPVLLPGDADFRTVQEAVYAVAPDMFVTSLTPATFDTFAHLDVKVPKFMLFSSKTEVPPMFRVLATNFRKGNQFGFVHESQQELLDQFQVKKLPHVAALFPRPDPKDKGSTVLGVMPYQGPMKLSALVGFVLQVSGSVQDLVGHVQEVPQVQDDDQLARHCYDKKRLCVLGILSADAGLLDLKRVAGKWEAGGQFSFLWLDAGAGKPGAGVAAQLEVPPSALPTAVVLSPTKLRMASLSEALSFETLNAFLDGLLVGRVRTSELKALPSFQVAAKMEPHEPEPTSAQDAGSTDYEPVEEEFDLSEILQESVESLSKEQKLQEVERELEEQERVKSEEAKQKKKKKKSKKKKSKGEKKTGSKDEL